MNSKIKQFLQKELSSLVDVIILKEEDRYFLFGNYEIVPHGDVFIVELGDTYQTERFNFLQCAITWCLYHYQKRRPQLTRIKQLDDRLVSVDLSIKIHKRMINETKDLTTVCITETKLHDELLRKEVLQAELNSLMAASKRWQYKKFKEVRA